jgi:TonB family protein
MIKKIFTAFWLLILLTGAALAQNPPAPRQWTRLESAAKDFSVAIPSGFQVMIDEKGYDTFTGPLTNPKIIKLRDIRFITAYQDGASFLIESYKVGKKLTEALNTLYPNTDGMETRIFEFGGLKGLMVPRQSSDSYSLEIVIGYQDRVYRIYGGAREEANETLRYFFNSLQFKGKPLEFNGKRFFEGKTSLDVLVRETPAALDELPETAFELEKKDPVDELSRLKNETTKNDAPVEIKPSESSKKLILLRKPLARYTEAARKALIKGTVRLRVTFGETGAVEKIRVVEGLGNGLTENAVRAARLIRFLPQQTDNKPVAVTKVVEYRFTIY